MMNKIADLFLPKNRSRRCLSFTLSPDCFKYCLPLSSRSVTDPRDGKRVALKKMPNVFQNLISCKRVYRELKMLFYFNHDNVREKRNFKIVT